MAISPFLDGPRSGAARPALASGPQHSRTLFKRPEIYDALRPRAGPARGSSCAAGRSIPAGLPARGRLGGIPTPPGVAKRKPEAASDGHWQRAVVGTYLLPAEVLLEPVDPRVFRHGFVLEEAAPVIAF